MPGDPCAEAPVLLAVSLREALLEALRSFGFNTDLNIDLPLPATPPKVLTLLKEISRNQSKKQAK
jgi:xanthine dehydrogenase molybdopterin-binding subunit B